ncbi:MAG: hypothetical protein ABH834_07175 [Candidatus Altiarchaeota archaeon]
MPILRRKTVVRDPQVQQATDNLTNSIAGHLQHPDFTEGSKHYPRVKEAVGKVADSLIRGGEPASAIHGALTDRLNLLSYKLQSKDVLTVKNFEAVMDAAVEAGQDDPTRLRTALSLAPGKLEGVKPKTTLSKRTFAAALTASVDSKLRDIRHSKAITDFIGSSGNLSSGHGYSQGLELVCNVEAAEAAYATADILGLSSKVVEQQVQRHLDRQGLNPVKDRVAGYQAFNTQVSDAVSGRMAPPLPFLRGAKAHAAEISQLYEDGAGMLKLARAVSALWRDRGHAHDFDTFAGSGQTPVNYLTSGNHTAGYASQLAPHIIERAGDAGDIQNLRMHVQGYSDANLKGFGPMLEARAKKIGVK